jgi:hypothetical protein
MEARAIARQRRLSERHLPWVIVTAFGALLTAVIALVIDQGVFADYEIFPAILRGYTLSGGVLGVSAAACCVFTFAYSLRKRSLQEAWVLGKGTLAAWLWAHVYFGVLSIVLALAHAGYGAVSFQLSTGKLLLLALIGVVGSGVVWRVIYAIVPARAAEKVGNYSVQASAERAAENLVEIEKLTAGRSQRLRQLTDWVLGQTPGEQELNGAIVSLPPDEQAAFSEVATLAAARRNALERERQQKRYLGVLSRMRILHVPFSLALLVLLPLHVIYAYDLPSKAVIPGALGPTALGGYQPSSACSDCHAEIYEEWKASMHAHAMNSPLMIAQTNHVVDRVLGNTATPDPKEICINCHGPVGAMLTRQATLPLEGGQFGNDAFLNEGISCVVCHQWAGTSQTGGGGFVPFQDGYEPGRTYFGPIADPVGNAFHESAKGAVFAKPEELCRNCHVVQLDRNGDGRHDRGVDLVLQTLWDEWAALGGGPTCLDCHMPVTARKRAAEAADIPFQQDREAPDRLVRDHSFVAVDYPLDDAVLRNASKPRREELLRGAASLSVPPESVQLVGERLRFKVEVRNTGTGHNMPGGFAFVRQMWLEVSVLDRVGRPLASSGVLASSADDLCDASIVDDAASPMRPFLTGCKVSDPQLVNFQQMLVDKVEIALDANGNALKGPRGENLLRKAPGAQEAIIQFIEGGPVPRVRPATKQPLAPIPFGDSSNFAYDFPMTGLAPGKLTVRLLFRTVPPYFLRAMNKARPEVGLERYIDAVEITQAGRVDVNLEAAISTGTVAR